MSFVPSPRLADMLFGRRRVDMPGAPRERGPSGGPEVELLIGGIRIRLPGPTAAADHPVTARAVAATE